MPDRVREGKQDEAVFVSRIHTIRIRLARMIRFGEDYRCRSTIVIRFSLLRKTSGAAGSFAKLDNFGKDPSRSVLLQITCSTGLLPAGCFRALHRCFRCRQLFIQLRLQTHPISNLPFQLGPGVFQLLISLA